MRVVRKIHSNVTPVFRTTPKQSKEASPKERFERTRAAARSPREIQTLLLRGSLPLVPNKASSDAGPELAGRESRAAMESPKALMCPLEKGVSWINKSSSDDRPGPGICDSKYVEDAKAARSVRVWDRVPMKDIVREIEISKSSRGQPCCLTHVA